MTDQLSDERLAALGKIADAATPGQWHWAGNVDYSEPYLATWMPGAGRCQVLSIGSEDRSMTGPAADSVREYAEDCGLDPDEMVRDWAFDSFGSPVQEPRLQFLTDLMCVNARDHVVFAVAPEATSRDDERVYRADVTGVRHPDAVFMAEFNPETARALLDRIGELERQRAEIRRHVEVMRGAEFDVLNGRPAFDAQEEIALSLRLIEELLEGKSVVGKD